MIRGKVKLAEAGLLQKAKKGSRVLPAGVAGAVNWLPLNPISSIARKVLGRKTFLAKALLAEDGGTMNEEYKGRGRLESDC